MRQYSKGERGSMLPKDRPLEILQVEDTPSDAVLTAHALETGDVPYLIHVVTDGKQALAFLKREGGFENASRPHLILLDLSLPGLNGHEVLTLIKRDEGLKSIPVVIFTTLATKECAKCVTGSLNFRRAIRVFASQSASRKMKPPGEERSFKFRLRAVNIVWKRV